MDERQASKELVHKNRPTPQCHTWGQWNSQETKRKTYEILKKMQEKKNILDFLYFSWQFLESCLFSPVVFPQRLTKTIDPDTESCAKHVRPALGEGFTILKSIFMHMFAPHQSEIARELVEN